MRVTKNIENQFATSVMQGPHCTKCCRCIDRIRGSPAVPISSEHAEARVDVNASAVENDEDDDSGISVIDYTTQAQILTVLEAMGC